MENNTAIESVRKEIANTKAFLLNRIEAQERWSSEVNATLKEHGQRLDRIEQLLQTLLARIPEGEPQA
jgi:uncharacterized coiled-coil protein SlyX